MTPTTGRPHAFPVSVKGVVVRGGQVLLLRNEREEWELPGGKLEPGEEPASCLVREVAEETGLVVDTGPILDSWLYRIGAGHGAGREVFVVTYGCHARGNARLVLSEEHREVGLFTKSDVAGMVMPEGYRRSIETWFARLRNAIDGVTDGSG